jgi:hypothetical protein
MKNISDLAQNKHDGERTQQEVRREQAANRAKQSVPVIALVVANLIFLSLDIRAFDVTRKMTGSVLLACVTVIVSGVLALLWWDILYPHSRRHSNQTQVKLAMVGTIFGVLLSAVLAFLDYIIGNVKVSEALLWGVVVSVTALQGCLLAWWWLIDNSIEAEARRQRSVSSRADLGETVDDFAAEIKSLENLSAQLESLRQRFPGKGQAAKAARALGYPVLATMLEDDDNDGIPNYKDKDWKPKQIPQAREMSFAQDTDGLPNSRKPQEPKP